MSSSLLKTILKIPYQMVMDLLPTRTHIVIDYMRAHGRFPDIENPQTFNEKVLWREIYDRDERLVDGVDKIKVKEAMARKFGADFVVPTLAVYDTVGELDFSAPPLCNPPYVIKANHGSAMNVFVRNADDLRDPAAIKKKLSKFLAFDYATIAEEWAYSQVQRKLFVEPLIGTLEGYPVDYKFHVFDGAVYATQVIMDRLTNIRCSVYDRNWKLMNFEYVYPRYKGEIPRPALWNRMVEMAEAIGREFSYVRVDLYAVDDKVRFGELTFYPVGGHGIFRPAIWDAKFGEQWKQSFSEALEQQTQSTPA